MFGSATERASGARRANILRNPVGRRAVNTTETDHRGGSPRRHRDANRRERVAIEHEEKTEERSSRTKDKRKNSIVRETILMN